MLKPEFEEVQSGVAEIREVFRSSKFGNIAGVLVRSGTITRNAKARVIRDGIVLADGLAIESLRRFKDDVTEVRAGFEAGYRPRALQRHPARRRDRDDRAQGEGASVERWSMCSGAAKMADRIRGGSWRGASNGASATRGMGFVGDHRREDDGDLQHASIFFTVLGTEQERADTAAALKSATGMLRTEVGRKIHRPGSRPRSSSSPTASRRTPP